MRRGLQNTDTNDTTHNNCNQHSSQSNMNQGLQDAMNAIWKKVDSELPAIDDIETISLHLEDTQNNQTQNWVHGKNMPVIETSEYSSINSKARERRRMKIEAENNYQTQHTLSNVDHGDAEECIYTGFYENNCLVPKENLTINHQMNCFTIINKHYAMKSDSSSELETCDEVEVIPRDDVEWYNRTSSDIALEHTNDPEKRTIWIYSFKNKPNLLTETEYELIDIPGVSGSESSMELGEEAAVYEKRPSVTATARVATPIPSSYVPRLDLSKGSTLPTVTEITEMKSEDEKSPQVFVAKKPKNSWFANDTTPSRITTHSDHKEEKPSEFHWAPSSARERRRRMLYDEDLKSRQKKIEETTTEKLPDITPETKRSVSSQTKPVEIIEFNDDDVKPHRTQISSTTTTLEECFNIEIAEGLKDVNTSSLPLLTTPQQRGKEVEHNSQDETQKEEQKAAQESFKEINQDDIRPDTSQLVTSVHLITDDAATPIPSGRYKKLHIKVSPNAKPIITETLENPETDDWICETKNEFSNSFENIHLQVDNAGTRLLVRNNLLLKPSRWDDYTPVADSLPSLQITIGDSDSEHDGTWWRRFLNCVLCR